MPSKSGTPSPNLQLSFQKLSQAANALNDSSETLGKAVIHLDIALSKLNLGVTSWICFYNIREDDSSQYHSEEQLGYAKIENKRGLSLRVVEFDDINNESHVESQWLFNDAPRDLRVKAIRSE